MIDDVKRVHQNYRAILVAAIVCFLFEMAWYSYFLLAWLDGIGHNQQWLTLVGGNFGLQSITAFLCEAVIAAAISFITQLTGPHTVIRGIRVAALLWFAFVLTTWATENVIEVRTYRIFAINTGFWLIGMIIMGAIVGGWKAKSRSQARENIIGRIAASK